MSVNLKKLFDLDTVTQTFGVIDGIAMWWRCPPDETPPDLHNNDGDWEPEWTPKYTIRNTMEECVEARKLYTISTEPVDGDTIHAMAATEEWVTMDAEHIVRIYENLELKHFPCDCQDLPVWLEARLETTEYVFVPLVNGDQPLVSLCKDANDVMDFDLTPELPFSYEFTEAQMARWKVSGLVVNVKMVRRAEYYSTCQTW